MIKFKPKLLTSLEEKLKNRAHRLAKIAGYGLLPKAKKTTVRNVPESTKYKTPNGDSCIGYWEKQTGCEIKEDTTYYCPSCKAKMSKKDSTLDGAHVFLPDAPDNWFFVPLCSTCNKKRSDEDIVVDTVLIPVPDECYEQK